MSGLGSDVLDSQVRLELVGGVRAEAVGHLGQTELCATSTRCRENCVKL